MIESPTDRLEHVVRLWMGSGHRALLPPPDFVLREIATPTTWWHLCDRLQISRTSHQHVPMRRSLLAMLRCARLMRLIESETEGSFALSEDGYAALGIARTIWKWGAPLGTWSSEERDDVASAVASCEPVFASAPESMAEGTVVCGCGHVETAPPARDTCPRCGEPLAAS